MSEPNNEFVQCPFCGDIDFDLIGLKAHIQNGWCDRFNDTLTIAEEEARRTKENSDD